MCRVASIRIELVKLDREYKEKLANGFYNTDFQEHDDLAAIRSCRDALHLQTMEVYRRSSGEQIQLDLDAEREELAAIECQLHPANRAKLLAGDVATLERRRSQTRTRIDLLLDVYRVA